MKDPRAPYSLDTTKYHKVNPKSVNIRTNGDILELADRSIRKYKILECRMYSNKNVKKNWNE